MDRSKRYALFPACDQRAKSFPSLEGLCRAIHRERRGAGLELSDDTLQLQDQGEPLPVVSVYLQDASGNRALFLGHVYVDGRGMGALQRALDAQRPSRDRSAPNVKVA